MADSTQPCWSFTPFRPGDRARESQVEKFFNSDATDRVKSVVREGIQNSLDAAVVDSAVNVRICIGKASAASVANYVGNLFDHLDAEGVRKKLSEIPEPGETVSFLTFEDFNTSGLLGDPFFNFFRGEGVSNKAGAQRGRQEQPSLWRIMVRLPSILR